MHLIPYFQPIVDMAKARIIGHEVLARIIKDGEVLSAGPMFTDPAIDEQTLLHYDRSVREQAFKHFVNAGQPGFLTINISPRWIEILEEDAIPSIELMKKYDISPEKLVFEITETHSDTDKLSHVVEQYKKAGV